MTFEHPRIKSLGEVFPMIANNHKNIMYFPPSVQLPTVLEQTDRVPIRIKSLSCKMAYNGTGSIIVLKGAMRHAWLPSF